VSEARTPEEEAIEPDDASRGSDSHGAPDDSEYDGPDPEEDAKGDGADEDQGT
jgi:hypothetical protein